MTYPAPVHDPSAPAASDMSAAFASSETYRIWRPGSRPLQFSGTELAMAMSYTPELPYWYEINVYRTEAQSFVLALRLFFQSETIDDTTKAWEFETINEVFDALEAYDAAQDVRVSFDNMPGDTPADLMAHAFELRAHVAAARAHFSGLIGEFFDTLDQAAA